MSTQAKNDIEVGVAERLRTVFHTGAGSTDNVELWERTWICNMASGTSTLYLPYVALAKGLRFTFLVRTGSNILTIADRDDSEGWTDVTIEDAGDTLTVESDGTQWILVESYEAD